MLLCIVVQLELGMTQSISPKGTAAVVDGTQVLLTPLQRTVLPPPMCAVAVTFQQPVQCLAFGSLDGTEVHHSYGVYALAFRG